MLARCSLLLLLVGCAGGQDSDSVAPEWSPLGMGDGSADSVGWTFILGEEDDLDDPRDLGFDAVGNLWVANRRNDKTFVIFEPGTGNQSFDDLKDGYAEHFMEETSAIAFDDNVQFGSCGESNNTYNDQGAGNGYMGPVLWSTDLNVFGVENPIGLGSHLDMSHESPYCVGIAWEDANIYWAFDGDHGAITRHDFQADHGIGMDEHGDHIVYQLTEPEVSRVEEAPGHMVFDRNSGLLYTADTGNGRLLWLDTASGAEGADLRASDPGAVRMKWEGADWGELGEGFTNPGGLAMAEDRLYVGDWGTGLLTELDLEGNVLRTLDTDFGPERLYGIEIGPDGLLWVIDVETGVYRIDP